MSSLDKPANPSPRAAMTPPTDQAPAPRVANDHGTSRFPPGSVFAGRYRMITRIGRGGMGEVWRADDLVLQTTVALKLLTSGSREGRGRILNEVRLARQITHPAVCRVFDVGEADGELFYSMELVEGEDLASVLARLGRLPLEKVLDIARQLCAGLAAAHAQGVLHRDLKPANVLIDERGRVRITDFGIAITRDRAGDHTPFGTPAYMAPEQFEPGTPLSERTDIYALGVVLYELLAGQRPLRPASGAPDSPSFAGGAPTSGLPVDSRFERVLLRCLSPDPRQRPASASEVLASLPTGLPDAEAPPRGRPWIRGAALVAVIVLVAVVGSRLLQPAPPVLTNQDVIVLADVLNTTGDPVFDGTLKVALAVALEQSPFLKVFSDDRVRDTLGLMQRPPGERVTRPIAREIAQREGLAALIAGSIAPLGSNYVIALEAIDTESAEVMAREQVEARGKEQVLTALGTAASRLREKLGESLGSIERFDVPLPRATTPSLEALHAYALALDQGRVVPRVEAIPHLERAVALDPDFALALALLSGVYANTGRSADAPPFARRAFELRDRVSERERFFISWRYHLDAEQAWDEALDLAQSWTTTYPREAFAFNSLGLASAAFGQHERAADAFREAIRLDESFVPPHGNLAGSLIALNRFDEAKTRLGEAAAHGVAFITVRRMAWVLAFLAGDASTGAKELALTRRSPEAVWASVWEARAAAFAGRFLTAHDLFQRSAETARRENARELAAQWTVEDAEAHAIAGQCADARREVGAGVDLGRDNFTLERASRTLALCGDAGGAARLIDELTRRFAGATLTTRVQLPVTGAVLALGQGDAARAVAILDPVAPYDRAPAAEFWPVYLRGQAHLRLGDGPAAAAQFRRIVEARGSAPTSPLYVLAYLGLARAATLSGDVAAARQGYERLLALWTDADANIGPLADARREYTRLQ